MYSVPQSRQLTIFLCALGFGFLLGILYDVFRTIRLTFTESKTAVVIFDILYFVTSGFLSFLFILAMNKGEVRFYIVGGEILGWLFYYFSFGIAVIKITDIITNLIKRFTAFIFRIITAPFRLIQKVFNKVLAKILMLFNKTGKKSQKIRKKHLPKLCLYVYNLLGIISVGRFDNKKGGSTFGKEEKSEKESN